MEEEKEGKMLVITAPSGAGKTTIVRHLLKTYPQLAFSVSATNRPRRVKEKNGVDYFFMSTEEFQEKIKNKSFLEWEEVYDGQYYGTLKSEITRIWREGKHIIFDIDVRGASNIKNMYPDQCLALFIKPPSIQTLINRLKSRKSETGKSLLKRIARVKKEMIYENSFDKVLVNDILEVALKEAELIVEEFIFQEYINY